jgi:hypothetical protein
LRLAREWRYRVRVCAVDGPLRPGFEIRYAHRTCDRLLSKGPFQKWCKPGPVPSPVGRELHRRATWFARGLRRSDRKLRLVEAFPNVFLGTMLERREPPERREKLNAFWERCWRGSPSHLERLARLLFDDRAAEICRFGRELTNREERAAFVCALTAWSALRGLATQVGARNEGLICLGPPASLRPWVRQELRSYGPRIRWPRGHNR